VKTKKIDRLLPFLNKIHVFLGLIESYMTRTFVKTVLLVVTLGLAHGLLFLPVSLSFFVPVDQYIDSFASNYGLVREYLATNLNFSKYFESKSVNRRISTYFTQNKLITRSTTNIRRQEEDSDVQYANQRPEVTSPSMDSSFDNSTSIPKFSSPGGDTVAETSSPINVAEISSANLYDFPEDSTDNSSQMKHSGKVNLKRRRSKSERCCIENSKPENSTVVDDDETLDLGKLTKEQLINMVLKGNLSSRPTLHQSLSIQNVSGNGGGDDVVKIHDNQPKNRTFRTYRIEAV